MKIVILDGATIIQNDMRWDDLATIGEIEIYDRTDASQVIRNIGDAEAVFTSKCCMSAEVMDACPNLKFIGALATGYDNIDIEAAKDEMPLEYRLLKAQDIHTVIVFPMFHTDTLWGFIGLDDPILDESQSLINLLTVVGSHLGSAYDSCHKSNLLDEKQNALQASIDAFQREQRFLQVLCRDYISVFFADLKKDYLEILKVDPEANVLQVSASEEYMTLSYKEIIESYCRQFMMQEEARKLKKRLNAERLMRELKTRDRISFRFQSLPNGAGHEYFEAQITRMAIDEENFKVLIGFRFIDDIVSENLDKLQSAGRYIQRLVDDVTDISQIESGHFHIEPAFFNVMTFFRDFQDIMGQMTADRKLHMTCRAHDILHPQIDADAIRLKQIYVNLVSNAVKYTPEGGMVHFELYEETSDSPGCVRLVSIVQDNGIGMTEDYMKKMYERFSRSVDTRINKVRGSGLGLAIVKELVDRMNGRIEVQSAVGVGTTFRVVFDFPFEEADSDMILQSPMESDLEMAGQSSTESDLTDCEGMHVLIAEDNELNYEVAHEILAMHGITSEQAENGKICVERFMEAPEGTYDAILMDMQMPVMNGLEATKMLRKMDQYHGNTIPIIAMTANVAKTDMDKCLAAGMTGHLAKPLDIHALIAALVSVRKREMQKWRRRIKQW